LAVGFFAAACLASWCMPTPKQMEKLANAAAFRKNVPPVGTPGPGDDEMPPEYWQAVMDDPRADAGRRTTGPSIRTLRLSEIPRHCCGHLSPLRRGLDRGHHWVAVGIGRRSGSDDRNPEHLSRSRQGDGIVQKDLPVFRPNTESKPA
jgi:hypothetical protein